MRPLPNAGPCAGLLESYSSAAALGSVSAPLAEAAVSFALTVESPSLHQPIFAEFTVRNQTGQAIAFDLGLNRNVNFEVAVTRPDGSTVTRRLQSEGLGLDGAILVPAGDSYTRKLLLNQWDDFAVAGEYKVKITLLSPMVTDRGEVIELQPSQELYLQVGQRDPVRLAEIANKLAESALSAPDISERMEAAEALSYIADPAAVPALARLLRQGMFLERYAIDGLARISTREAIGILWGAAAASSDPEVRSFAIYTLTQMGSQVKPQVID